ncbi:hypothetical protein [Pararhizobium sp.]|uniref:hypothetical protein n=1 Tax=Pararhizobium sp. TaxID=1977563 RepID=UPI003D132B70
MRRVSLNQRIANDSASTEEIYAALFFIDHSSLAKPIRLSTDNTERLSSDPLYYGTRSTWMTGNPIADPFLWIVASTLLPSDMDDAPAAATIIIENVDNEIAKLLRSFTDLATMHIAVVLASSPNMIEVEYRDLKIVSHDLNPGEVTLQVSRQDVEEEDYPVDRMTKDKFPGLHR